MCLGIAGEIVELASDHPDLAMVNVSGVVRRINVGLLEPGEAAPGRWVLVHLGFALSPIEESEARASLAFLQACGPDGPQDASLQDGAIEPAAGEPLPPWLTRGD